MSAPWAGPLVGSDGSAGRSPGGLAIGGLLVADSRSGSDGIDDDDLDFTLPSLLSSGCSFSLDISVESSAATVSL